MFALLSKLAEILAQFGNNFLASRRTAQDAEVAAVILRYAVTLQEVCVCGERILVLAGELVSGKAQPGTAEEFSELMERQAGMVETMRSDLDRDHALLLTVDAGVYLELAPFLDGKSGLLTRWGQQAGIGRFSTTTLFYLPAEALDRAIAIGKASADADGMKIDRSAYVVALADGARLARSREVRDLRRAVTAHRAPRIREEITSARAELCRARSLSGEMLAATEKAVGADVMARLRRSLVQKPI